VLVLMAGMMSGLTLGRAFVTAALLSNSHLIW
jgi:hypothetical protein